MMPMDDRSQIAYKMEARKSAVEKTMGNVDGLLEPDPLAPRWRIDSRWVEFECGCRAERCLKLYGAKNYDPVIFRGEPQQAVYDSVCQRHNAGMNVITRFGGYVDFNQWKIHRRARLMGKVKP